MSEGGNHVEVHVIDPTKDYPGGHPYPLAYLIPRAELELDRGEIEGRTMIDLLHHVKRLERVRKTLEEEVEDVDEAREHERALVRGLIGPEAESMTAEEIVAALRQTEWYKERRKANESFYRPTRPSS